MAFSRKGSGLIDIIPITIFFYIHAPTLRLHPVQQSDNIRHPRLVVYSPSKLTLVHNKAFKSGNSSPEAVLSLGEN
jgi:hypothetical protein